VLGNSFQNRIEIFSRLVTFEFMGSFAEFPDLRFSAMPDHQPRLVALIDEAGCHGESYDRGSSHFLSMGAAVTAISETDNVLGTFNEARAEREHTKTFKKFISDNDKDNFVLTKLLAQKPICTVMVALHKPSMTGSYVRSHPKEEYRYLVKFTLERISWIARDSAVAKKLKPEESQCRLVFSEQKSHSYEDLYEYLNKLRNGGDRFNCSIEWDYLHPDIEYESHKNEQLIHFGDIVASAFHRAIDPKRHGMTDDRFARNLIPTIYSRSGRPYGLKIFPPAAIDKLQKVGQLGFLKMFK
jgi:hypothetical protein